MKRLANQAATDTLEKEHGHQREHYIALID